MKTTSRKRLLISSVAMLLVAMLALGTATFAWFTSSTTATASGINVKTIKASKLEISSAEGDWGTKIDYAVKNLTLLPTSTANGTTWFKTNAVDRTSFAGPTDAGTGLANSFEAIDVPENYYWHEQLNVHNAGDATVNNAKITFSMPSQGASYLRVALVEADSKGKDATIKGDFAKSIFDNSGEKYFAATSTTAAATEITPENTTYEVSLGSLAKDDVKYYNLYVWFEGQDKDCKDANAGAVVPDIKFNVTGDTAIES